MKNLFIIHSYNADTKESFGPYLQTIATDMEYEVHFPSFPIRKEAKYDDWEKIMDSYLINGQLNEESIVVAHSLGTHFIPKYIASRNIQIKGYISVAGFLNDRSGRIDPQKIIEQFKPSEEQLDIAIPLLGQKYSIYSNNDHISPQFELEYYAERLNSNKIFIPNVGHLGKDSGITELPELQNIINNIENFKKDSIKK